jgi:hypothetical protein
LIQRYVRIVTALEHLQKAERGFASVLHLVPHSEGNIADIARSIIKCP